MSESFDGVMEEMREKVASPYWINMADRLQRAHDREIVEALCDACDQCDRMDKKAYEHEMEHVRKAEYHRGYEAGQRSMEAKHRTVTERLVKLDLAGGSHENLSAIASCFYQPAFGWTRGACETLRDKLIEILEGKDGNDDNNNSDGCNRNHHCCDQRQVSYYELGNERRKAVRKLRDARDSMSDSFVDNVSRIVCAIDARPEVGERVCKAIADRLIHLLGGDQQTLSDLYGIWQDDAESESRGSESARKMTKSAEIGELDVNGTSPNDDGTCPNDDPSPSITDELREKCDRLKAKVEHQREQLAVYATMYDFDAIRALKRERNEHKHRADNADGRVKSLERRMDAAHETYRALLNDAAREFRALMEERDELQAKLDDYDKTHIISHATVDVTPHIDWSRMADELAEFVEIVRGMAGGAE